MISGAHKLATTVVSEIIEDAKDAELCRNIAMMREALEPVWPDIEKDPDYAGFDPIIEARLLRLSGFFLSFYGKSTNRTECHSRAKDLLSAAVNLFASEGASDEEAEANIMLAVAYQHSGQMEEFDAILDTIEQSDDGRLSDNVWIQLQLNRIVGDRYRDADSHARSILENVADRIERCSDFRLKTMYFNQAGLVYGSLGSHDRAISEMGKAVECSKKSANPRFLGLNLNNLAVLYCGAGDQEVALSYAENSLEVFRRLGDRGWIPHVLDTKALILLARGDLAEALSVSSEAIEIFRKGSDHAGLCEAKWTQVRILLKLGRMDDALQAYGRLYLTAVQNIGTTASSKYTRLLVDELGLEPANKEIVRLEDLEVFDGEQQIHIFSVAPSVLIPFGIYEQSAVPVRPVRRPRARMALMYIADDGELYIRRVGFDAFSSMFFVDHDPDFPTPLEQVILIGEVFGHRPLAQMGTGPMEFFDFPE